MEKKKTTFLKKILIPIIIIMFVQSILLYGFIIFGGTIKQLKNNALDILEEKVSNRKNILENDLTQSWSNIDGSVNKVLETTTTILNENKATTTDIKFQNPLSQSLLSSYVPELLYMLRKNAVSGAFVVLEGDQTEKDGLWIRDTNPQSNPNDYSDLLIERGPSEIIKNLNIGMNSYWHPYFNFSTMEARDTKFYTKPFDAAKVHPGEKYKNFAYWSPPFYLNRNSEDPSLEMITYSVPLINKEGVLFGVLGIEIAGNYLKKSLPSEELNSGNKNAYALIVGSEEKKVEFLMTTVGINQIANEENTLVLEPYKNRKDIYLFKDQHSKAPSKEIIGVEKKLSLYRNNTPFANEQWSLVGAVEENKLFDFANEFQGLILGIWMLAMLVGIVGIMIVAKIVAKPIRDLSNRLRNRKENKNAALGRVNIVEIDDLLEVVEDLSKEVIDSAFRLSKVLEMTGVTIGTYEYNQNNGFHCTEGIYKVLNITKTQGEMTYEGLNQYFEGDHVFLEEDLREDQISVYRIEENNKKRWVRVKTAISGDTVLGVITDITEDMITRKKIEYERDYDLLTNLNNRRAFHEKITGIFKTPEKVKIGAIIMIDLDNLKYVNDTYGHDYGDAYIRNAGNILRYYENEKNLIARLSGDEFIVLCHGYDSIEEIEKVSKSIQKDMKETPVHLPNHEKVNIRASGGIAWYPKDSKNHSDLMHYADFAMYMVKKTTKGQFINFDNVIYKEESYLLFCREELNALIDDSLFDYAFQPIFDGKTGDLFGVEALIRPRSKNIKNPSILLSLAKTQSKLTQIERITFFKSMEKFVEGSLIKTECKVFINSISSQVLAQEEIEEFEKMYASYLNRIVIEITEGERSKENMTKIKENYSKKWNAEIALDDFGSGYNNEKALLDLCPNYVKVDMEIVQKIGSSKDHLQVLRNLVAYSKERNIKVIAEGVETKEVMAILIKEEVDYIQGYYLGRPTIDIEEIEITRARDEILSIWRSDHE